MVYVGLTLGPSHLREEDRLKVSENRVLGIIFRPKTDEVPGDWRRLHIRKLHKLHPLPNIVPMIKSEMRWAGHVARMGRVLYRDLLEKPEGRRLLFIPTHRCENNIKIDLIYIYWDGVDRIYLAQGRGR